MIPSPSVVEFSFNKRKSSDQFNIKENLQIAFEKYAISVDKTFVSKIEVAVKIKTVELKGRSSVPLLLRGEICLVNFIDNSKMEVGRSVSGYFEFCRDDKTGIIQQEIDCNFSSMIQEDFECNTVICYCDFNDELLPEIITLSFEVFQLN